MAAFTMPSLGADMDEGTLLEWLVHPGDTVRQGDIVAVVDTAKAAIEVETFLAGVISELLVTPGTTVPVGAPLATIETAHTPQPAEATPAAGPVASGAASPVQPPRPVDTPAPEVQSPLVRRLAAENGVDLTRVPGTGRDGTITRDDVTRAAAGRPSAPVERGRGIGPVSPRTPPPTGVRATPYARRLAAELGVELASLSHPGGEPVTAEEVRAAHQAAASSPSPAASAAPPAPEAPTDEAPVNASRSDQMRAAIAALMARSKREIPHYYLSETVDLTRATEWLRERNRSRPVAQRLVPAALLLKATALAATEVPQLNGYWLEDQFRAAAAVHLGVAVSLRGGGLVTPAILDAESLELDDLMAQIKDLVSRSRGGRLRGRELTEGTLTVTNLGEQGVESVYGVIYPPQVALVGYGRIVERPWAVDGLLGVRPVTTVTLSADHRASDAMTGARFLARIEDHLQHPEGL